MDPRKSDSRPVYSTDGGRIPDDGRRTTNRKFPTAPPPKSAGPGLPDDGVVRVQRSSKGRGGKTVTLVTGLPGREDELEAILKGLKQHCGTGGYREGRALALQGDQRERLMARLSALGHKPKLAGG